LTSTDCTPEFNRSRSFASGGVGAGVCDQLRHLIWNDFARFTLAKRVIQFNRGIFRFGAETGPLAEQPYAAARFVRVAGPTPEAEDVYSPMLAGWTFPVLYKRMTVAVQAAFLDHFAFQCGYCTPGFVNAAQVLVESLARAPTPRADVEARIVEAMDGHICRCTGYVRYYTALREVILADPKLTR